MNLLSLFVNLRCKSPRTVTLAATWQVWTLWCFSSFSEHLNALFASQESSFAPFNADAVIHTYNLGYAAVLSSEMVEELRQNPDVDFIEANQVVNISNVQKAPLNWGLDRISTRDLPLKKQYVYSEKAGEGVDVYIVDTGVLITHNEFGGLAEWGFTAPSGEKNEDGNGHGTHVASTVAGINFGVAKKAHIIAVKVLRSSGYGTTADVVKGIEWVGKAHKKKSKDGPTKSVANMSLGGGKSNALDLAVSRVIAAGVLFIVAAGNDNSDACGNSPAGVKSALTVGATDKYDDRSYFSNFGKCVDIFAPGSAISAAWKGSNSDGATISGTSMASPHACGVAALFLAEDDLTPAELKAAIIEAGSKDKVANVGKGSPNVLLFNNAPSELSTEEIIDSLKFQ